MAGEFSVAFRYQETVALRSGYEPQPVYVAEAVERVLVVEDAPGRIALQHLLLMGESGLVVKHWREDWVYQPTRMLKYLGDEGRQRTWSMVAVGQKLPGYWARQVYEADDGPAYGVTGRWQHEAGVSTWDADGPAFAPLPRREASRTDYDAIEVHDRITRTPDGWSQEQDTVKFTMGVEQPPLVRESGIVRYRRGTADLEATPTDAFWQARARYWQRVRAVWDALIQGGKPLTMVAVVEARPRWRAVFEAVETAAGTGQPLDAFEQELQRVLLPYIDAR